MVRAHNASELFQPKTIALKLPFQRCWTNTVRIGPIWSGPYRNGGSDERSSRKMLVVDIIVQEVLSNTWFVLMVAETADKPVSKTVFDFFLNNVEEELTKYSNTYLFIERPPPGLTGPLKRLCHSESHKSKRPHL